MAPSVEIVTGYDADGHAHDRVVVNGHETSVTYIELDPDHQLLRHGRGEVWLRQHEQQATTASMAAARWIRHWAAQTAEYGAIDPDDEPAS